MPLTLWMNEKRHFIILVNMNGAIILPGVKTSNDS